MHLIYSTVLFMRLQESWDNFKNEKKKEFDSEFNPETTGKK